MQHSFGIAPGLSNSAPVAATSHALYLGVGCPRAPHSGGEQEDRAFRQREFVRSYVSAIKAPPPAAMIPTHLPGINTDGELTIIRSDFSRERSNVEALPAPGGEVGSVVAMLTRHVARGQR